MLPMLDYRPASAEGRRPWMASLLAAAIGLIWGATPICAIVGTGYSIFSGRVIFLIFWSAIVGLVAGCCTIWTRARRGGVETPIGLVGTYYVAIVCFWIGLAVMGWSDMLGFPRFVPTFVWPLVKDEIDLLLSLLGYGTMLGLITIPACYICREQVWKAYVQRSARGTA